MSNERIAMAESQYDNILALIQLRDESDQDEAASACGHRLGQILTQGLELGAIPVEAIRDGLNAMVKALPFENSAYDQLWGYRPLDHKEESVEGMDWVVYKREWDNGFIEEPLAYCETEAIAQRIVSTYRKEQSPAPRHHLATFVDRPRDRSGEYYDPFSGTTGPFVCASNEAAMETVYMMARSRIGVEAERDLSWFAEWDCPTETTPENVLAWLDRQSPKVKLRAVEWVCDTACNTEHVVAYQITEQT